MDETTKVAGHTPGPWEIIGDGDIAAEKWGEGAGWHELALSVDNEADAHLIAAAPDLLATLEALAILVVDDSTYEDSPILEAARVTIARAKGSDAWKRAYEKDTKGHKWQTYEDGSIDISAYEAGDHHNGPRCVRCGYGFCHHCEKEPRISCAGADV